MSNDGANPVEPARADRRPQRSREALCDAIVSLLATKSYDQITVQDLADRANVGRSTVYIHFRGKDDLLIAAFDRTLRAVAEQIVPNPVDGGLAFSTVQLFRHAQGDHSIFRTLMWGQGATVLAVNGHSALTKRLEDRIAALMPDEDWPVPLSIVAYVAAGALLHLLKWWHDNNLPCSPERMDEYFQILVMNGLNAMLDGHSAPSRSHSTPE